MKYMYRYILIFIFLLAADLLPQPKLQFADIGRLPLTNGDTLIDCRIGYRTFGKLNGDSSNVILFLTWFGGSSEQLSGLIGKNGFVDDSLYFVVAIDALGNGISTSPSNYGPQSFPEISIRDMVNSQYHLLKNIFGFNKIYGAVGGSMGSMQVFEWITSYPEYIKKAVPYVCTPKSTANDLLQWNIRLEIIDSYRKLGADDRQINKILSMLSAQLGRTPDYLAEKINADEFKKYLDSFDREPGVTFTIDNYRAQLKAMISHNIYNRFGNSIDSAANVITAEVFMIISLTDHLLHPKTSMELAEKINAKLLILDNNCGHLAVGCELDRCSREIRDFFFN